VALLAARAAAGSVALAARVARLGQHGAAGPMRCGASVEVALRWRGPRRCHLITSAPKLYKKIKNLYYM
jgi:hypothetical protein